MAATIIGTISTNGHTIQKQSFATNRSGLIRLTETWLINSADLFSALPAFKAVHATYAYLFYQECSIDSIGVDLCRVQLTYEGASLTEAGSTSTVPFYSLQTGTMAVPIAQHPSVSTWIGTEKTAGRNPTDSQGLFVGWKLGAVSSGSQSLYGLDSYEYPTAIWSKEWVASSAPDATDLARLGKIDTPSGSPPTVASSNWLCIEISYRDIGSGMVQRTERWKLSQANAGGGWNSDVY